MTVDPELLELMPDTVTIQRATGDATEFGRPTFGETLTLRCLIEGKLRRVLNMQGQEVISNVTVYLAESPGIKPSDKLTLPARYRPRNPTIKNVAYYSDQFGPYCEVIYA